MHARTKCLQASYIVLAILLRSSHQAGISIQKCNYVGQRCSMALYIILVEMQALWGRALAEAS